MVWIEAQTQGIDVLVKISRRFICVRPWVDRLAELALNTQALTFSGENRKWGFGFRTDACGMHVRSWQGEPRDMINADSQRIRGREGGVLLAEHHVHLAAQKAHQLGAVLDGGDRTRARPQDHGAFVLWEYPAVNSYDRRTDFLWHDIDTPFDYARVAQTVGLCYTASDFENVNG